MSADKWEDLEIHQIWTQNRVKQDDWSKKTQKKYWFKLPQEWNFLSKPACVCPFICTLFPPTKHFTCFITFHFFVENHFLQSSMGQGLVTGHWSSGEDSALSSPQPEFNLWLGTKTTTTFYLFPTKHLLIIIPSAFSAPQWITNLQCMSPSAQGLCRVYSWNPSARNNPNTR